MSGGRLVVLDRAGRDVKHYPLAEGLATLGTDPACDIRVMLPTVSPHHATVIVHANQTVVRSVSEGETLVNGVAVSVAALRHNDVISLGGRHLRWEYSDPHVNRPLAAQPALCRAGGRSRRARPSEPAARNALVHAHRASMPASASMKQVAIVQPQRRDTGSNDGDKATSNRSPVPTSTRRHDASLTNAAMDTDTTLDTSTRKSTRPTPKSPQASTTKASQWIESRKSNQRASLTPKQTKTPPKQAKTPKHNAANTSIEDARPSPTPKQAKNTPKQTRSTPKLNSTNTSIDESQPSLTPIQTRVRASLTPLQAKTPSTHVTKMTPKQTRASVTPNLSLNRSSTPNLGRVSKGRASIRSNLSLASDTLSPNESRKSSRASLTPNLTKTSIRASVTPNQSRTSTRASRTPNQTKTSTRATLTPNQTRTSNRTSLTPNVTRSTMNRSSTLTPNQSRTLSRASLTPRLRLSLRPGRPTITPIRASEKKETLRMTVLKRNTRPVKIEAPTSIDHTKQAAIMLMTRHTKSKSPNSSTVSYVVKKHSPVKKTPRNSKIGATPRRASGYSQTSRKSTSSRKSSASVLEINDSDVSVQRRSSSRRSKLSNSDTSPPLPSPKKSALKNPKNTSRKTESIKFDLSNLESETGLSDIVTIDSTNLSQDTASDMSLHYSDTSIKSPSPRRPIHSRSSRIMEKTLGSPMNKSIEESVETMTPQSPRSRNSTRSSIIVQKALEQSNSSRLSRRLTKTVSEQSWSTTVPNRTKTLSPRQSNVESYSIVDLVSVDSNGVSEYNSAASTPFGTPTNNSRKSRSLDLALTSSTPYNKVNKIQTPLSESKISESASMITPENDENFRPFNSTRISRASRSRSRINDSDLLLLDDDDSPRTSKRTNKSAASPFVPKSLSVNISNPDGTITPENVPNNDDCGTPVLSIQSLLDSSQGSLASMKSSKTGKENNTKLKRKTIGVIRSARKPVGARSRSFNVGRSSRRNQVDPGSITPTNEFLPEQEGVKNKHSTAKKPQSKRSIIDNLNESDIVKQLFNSPVKRKLSQSMTEFSRRQLFEDDDNLPRKQTRQTTALTGRTPDNSFLDQTQAVTPDVFVSPLSTPSNSPNLEGVKRLFAKNTPENDLRNVRGVKGLLRTPRNRKSIKNDLTNVSGVKATFAKSPKNRLSDVRVKELFIPSPRNDLRRVSGVKTIFKSTRKQRTPKNSLEDVRGVKNLYKRSPRNNLSGVSGVKEALQIKSPRNDLTDVRGVRRMFRLDKQKYQSDVSGIEQLFHESTMDTTFDLLIGKPPLRTYAKSASAQKAKPKMNTRRTMPLIGSLDLNDDENWLEKEKQKRQYKEHMLPIKKRSLINKSANDSKARLPIKKRVVHSTPMKANATMMNASELGRVSPIALVVKNVDVDTTVGISQVEDTTAQITQSETVATKRRTKASANKENISVASPRKTRASKVQALVKVKKPKATKTAEKSPKGKANEENVESQAATSNATNTSNAIAPRRTRRKANTSPVQAKASKDVNIRTSIPNTIKKRQSLVITKKTPVARPKPQTRKVSKQDSEVVQEPTKANTRKKTQETLKVAHVIAKPSPVKRTRQKVEAVVEEVKPKRGRKNEVPVEENTKSTVEVAKRTRKTRVVEETEAKPAKGTRKQEDKVPVKQKSVEIQEERPKRARNTETAANKSAKAVKKTDIVEVEEKPKRGRKTAANVAIEEPAKRTRRNQKIEEVVLDEPKKTRRKDTTVIPEVERVKEVKGKKLVKSQSADQVEKRSTRKVDKVASEVQVDVKPARGRKAPVENVPPPTEGRKRKINASPVKETVQRVKKLKAAVSSPAKPRQTRSRAAPAPQQTARARKR